MNLVILEVALEYQSQFTILLLVISPKTLFLAILVLLDCVIAIFIITDDQGTVGHTIFELTVTFL